MVDSDSRSPPFENREGWGSPISSRDADGPAPRRISKTITGMSTGFLYEDFGVVQELSGNTPIANLLTGGIDEIFVRIGSAVENFLANALGSSVAATDQTGNGATQYTYEPFGKTSSTGVTTSNAFQYTGRENDGTGLYFYRSRYYNPSQQRFISQDPLGFGGGDFNLHAYVVNSPVNLIDPSGLTWQTNWNFFKDWAFGRGPRNRTYGPNSVETQEMADSIGADRLRQFFYNKKCKDVPNYGYGTARAAWDTLLNPRTADLSSTAAQVGAWGPGSAKNNGNGTVTFTIKNKAGTNSFFYHVVPDRKSPTGMGSNIYQTFQWTEPIQPSGQKDDGNCN